MNVSFVQQDYFMNENKQYEFQANFDDTDLFELSYIILKKISCPEQFTFSAYSQTCIQLEEYPQPYELYPPADQSQ